jgi:hypothetical protein
VFSVCDVSRGEGDNLPFIDQGEGELQACALFSYMWRYGVQRHGVGGRPGGPCPDLVVVAHSVLEQGQLRG